LTSPRAVRNALAYVLNNFRHHSSAARGVAEECLAAEKCLVAEESRIDPFSSAPYFNGFRELSGCTPNELRRPRTLPLVPAGVLPPKKSDDIAIVAAETWLAKVGWRRAGALGFSALGVDDRNAADRGIGA
jgi:hypothetical protein